mmetsp:Transcript_29789/g.77218  ORF Transcript_29789/g.77218 Transcript_29789/m.77218 type:complete len:87 (-) Transcript_29789:60-320(-)
MNASQYKAAPYRGTATEARLNKGKSKLAVWPFPTTIKEKETGGWDQSTDIFPPIQPGGVVSKKYGKGYGTKRPLRSHVSFCSYSFH